MQTRGISDWTAAWAALLLCAATWVALDPATAEQFVDMAVRRFDLGYLLATTFVVIGALNLFALAFRILTLRNE